MGTDRTKTRVTLIIALLLALPAYGQLTQTEVQKLVGHDSGRVDLFGYSVAADRDTVIVGAKNANPGDGGGGAAYIYIGTGGTWTQQAKLVASDSQAGEFGYSVAIDGETAIVGAPTTWDGDLEWAGAAYVFIRSGGIWILQAKLLASDTDAYDYFGYSVAIDGDTAVIGAYWEDDSGTVNNGAAYVFTREAGTWTQQAKLLASDKVSYDNFGYSVSIDGDSVLIGAWHDNDGTVIRSGAAYVFTRSGGLWSQQTKLIANDRARDDRFGKSVALDGDTLFVGADYSDSDGLEDNGAVYVFARSGDSWIQQDKLLASDRTNGDWFGNSLAIDGDSLVIGARGRDDGSSENIGIAYVFTRSAGIWSQQSKLQASENIELDYVGWSVGLTAGTAFAGAPLAGEDDVGAVYVFNTGEASSPGALMIRALGDINGDGSQDIVVLANKDGTLTAKVKDAEDRHRINTVPFDGSFIPVDLEVMPDMNGNGAPELVVLGTGSTRSEARDSLTGENLGTVDFDPALSPIDLELVTDQTGDGVPEFALLGAGSVKVEVEDPVSQDLVKTISFNNNYIPIDLSVWQLGDKVSVAVLAESKDPTRGDKVEIRDLASGQIVTHLWVGKPWDLLQMELVADLNDNGAPELAILREHPDDNWVSVQTTDTASGGRFMRLGFDPNYRPVRFRVLDDLNGNGSQEVAVLAVRRGCCNQKVWVKDTLTGESIRVVYFGKTYIGEDMDISPDINGNGTPELVVLGKRDDGVLRAIIKDSKTGEFISSVGF